MTTHSFARDRAPIASTALPTLWRYRWNCGCERTGVWRPSARLARQDWVLHVRQMAQMEKEAAMHPNYCPCCFGDPELVCAACGEHACWAGRFLCDDAGPAGVVTRAEFAAREREAS